MIMMTMSAIQRANIVTLKHRESLDAASCLNVSGCLFVCVLLLTGREAFVRQLPVTAVIKYLLGFRLLPDGKTQQKTCKQRGTHSTCSYKLANFPDLPILSC